MATTMKVSARYGTHLPCLIKVMAELENRRYSGDVLELGMGVFSTPYLHYQCMLSHLKLVSYENSEEWAQFFKHYGYENESHEIKVVEKYSDADIDRDWALVLVDQTPDSSRAEEVKRLADTARYIVIHDSNKNMDNIYHYSEIYPLFEYKKVWDKDSNHATILSNFEELEHLW